MSPLAAGKTERAPPEKCAWPETPGKGKPTMDHVYDRAAEDVGNIVHLEHVNLRIPEQRLATLFYVSGLGLFYVSGLGLTRDPYLMTGIGNMWVNVGRS